MYIYIKLICYGKMEPLLIYMHVQYLQQHTEKAYYVETLRTCDLLYMHSKKQNNNSEGRTTTQRNALNVAVKYIKSRNMGCMKNYESVKSRLRYI